MGAFSINIFHFTLEGGFWSSMCLEAPLTLVTVTVVRYTSPTRTPLNSTRGGSTRTHGAEDMPATGGDKITSGTCWFVDMMVNGRPVGDSYIPTVCCSIRCRTVAARRVTRLNRRWRRAAQVVARQRGRETQVSSLVSPSSLFSSSSPLSLLTFLGSLTWI